MQTRHKGAHFAQYFGLVREEDVGIRSCQLDDARARNAPLKGVGVTLDPGQLEPLFEPHGRSLLCVLGLVALHLIFQRRRKGKEGQHRNADACVIRGL